MLDKPMMKCGHAANCVRKSDNKMICGICYGIKEGADVEDDSPPDLTGRKAYCAYGKHGERDSSPKLAFFEHLPNQDHDRYYCGCYGWD